MTPGAWASVATVCALGAASPGPSLAVVARHAVAGSRAHGLACALAHAAGVGLYALLTAGGLAALLVARPELYRVIAVAGALYLGWIGVQAVRAGAARVEADAPAAAGLGRAARDGLAIALLNPKIAVFFLALFSQFVEPGAPAGDTVLLWLTAMGIDAAWYSLVAATLAGSPRLRGLRRHGRLVNRAIGVLLIALGAWTLLHATGVPG